jgi:hypothetical protein
VVKLLAASKLPIGHFRLTRSIPAEKMTDR